MDNSIWENRGYILADNLPPVTGVPSGYIKDSTGRQVTIEPTVTPNETTIIRNVAPRNSGYITDGNRRININNGNVSSNYPMSSTGFSFSTPINIPTINTNVDNTPVHQGFLPGQDVSKYYRYNPKTTQASREGYQQYVNTVNAWDKQKATPEQQYVNNFINSYDQYQRIRNGWR